MSAKLSPKQRAFVVAFLGKARGNATQAAILAGYSQRTAKQQGSRLLTNVDVRAALDHQVETRERAAIATADECDAFLTQVMRGEVWCDIDDRIKAAQELNRVKGRHTQTVEHKGKVTLEQLVAMSWELPA